MYTNFHVDVLNGVEVDALNHHLEANYLEISGFGNFPFGFVTNPVCMPNFKFLTHLQLVEQLCGQTATQRRYAFMYIDAAPSSGDL